MNHIKDNLDKIKAQINLACQQKILLTADSPLNNNKSLATSNDNATVKLLAVSKIKPSTDIKQAYLWGQRDFGENYLQEALEKITELSDLSDICWHFIGPIQSNKTKQIAQNFSWVHSVDREKIALRLNQHLSDEGSNIANDSEKKLNVCIQININNEQSKSGLNEAELFSLADIIHQCDRLTLRGIMAIPEKDAQVETYQKMQNMYLSLKAKYATVDTLSLGMSDDLSIAIAHGSTMVRIGSAIFGARAKTVQ